MVYILVGKGSNLASVADLTFICEPYLKEAVHTRQSYYDRQSCEQTNKLTTVPTAVYF